MSSEPWRPWGIFFAECDGKKFVELTSLAKQVQKKMQGDRALASVWRRLGYDVLIPPIEGIRGMPFPTQRGHARAKLMPAANLRGFETYVGELNEDEVEANAALLKAVARELLPAGAVGGADVDGVPFQLASRHKVMKLGPEESTVHIVQLKGKPLMVLTTLLETFQVSNPRRCIQHDLLPFFRACGVSGCDVSDDVLDHDNEPILAGVFPDWTPLAKYLESDVEDYERGLAARSGGLVRGRSAWNDGRETWLIDFPLLVLVINRLRTPQARRFQLASLEQSLVIMSGRQDVASRLAKYWREERMARPDNFLLQFMGATVDHEMQLRSEDDATGQGSGAVEARVVQACQVFLASAVPKLVDTLATKCQDVLAAQTRAQQDALAAKFQDVLVAQPSSVRPVVNINSSPHGGQDALEHENLDAPEDDAAAARIRGNAASLDGFLRSCWQLQWTRAGVRHTAVSSQFAILMQA